MSAIGIIGGSGLYDLDGFENREEIDVETPFGPPSDKIIGGTFAVVLGRVRKLFVTAQQAVDRLNKIINESILGAALVMPGILIGITSGGQDDMLAIISALCIALATLLFAIMFVGKVALAKTAQ